MMTVAVNIAINGSSLLFLIFMMVVYFSKKNMNNIDNKLFRLLLICNFFNSFVHIIFLILQWYHVADEELVKTAIRGYWIPEQIYFFLLICYMYYILKSDDKEFLNKLDNNKKKVYSFIFSMFFIIFLVFAIAPFNVVIVDSTITDMNGIATILFYVLIVLLFLSIIVALFLYRKKDDKKKILPFKILFIFIIVGIVLASIYPMLCVTEFLVTIISYVMFHTIENPDLKLVNQLTLAMNEAEKASKAKSEFLSSMSHELRTPLNAIVGLSTLIKENSTDPDSRNDAVDIYNASNNLLELVDGILDINKLESNEMEIVEKNYNLHNVLDSVVRSAIIRVGQKKIDLKTSFSADIPNTLYGDSDKIKIILNNLLSNAVKYTESGSIKLTVDAFNNKEKCNLTFTVSDTGRGIPEDKLNNLFTKFYRLEEDRDSDIEGTGLGLSITKSLVELLDGKITVDSVYGEGSTFTVTLSQKIIDNNQSIDETELL